MENLKREIEQLRKKHPAMRKGSAHPSLNKNPSTADIALPRYGTITDNKDPEKLGRVKAASDVIAPGTVTPWIPVIAPGAGKDTGWWQLPETGDQALMAFVGEGHQTPVLMGSVYNINRQPPKHTTEKIKDSKVWQSKAHRVEFIDEGGKESIIVSGAEGQMRIVISKDGGIELTNELRDIKIKCRKLKIEGGKGVQWEGKKKVKIKIGDEGKIKSKKGVQIENGKEVKVKGKNIKLEGSKGITTEGKQIAAEGDKVMGMDVHRMVVPSGKGTDVIPLPHPFIGKLADKLSKDVKIKGHNAAVKGSVAKHDNPVHNQLPGTIKFQKGPKKEGEVTGGTGKKVKINGKEAAVIGSTVTTCNDMGMRGNSVILAIGASVPMPVIINPKNMKEYKLEREKEKKKKPEFTGAKWAKTSVKEGEEAELTAQVKDIEDGNVVTFQVWREGQDPAANVAMEQITAVIEGGTAKGKWKLFVARNEIPPEKDPKYFFTAHSAWCPYKKSGNMTVELKRPEITKCEWQDEEGKGTEKNVIGEDVKLTVETKDIEDGKTVTLKIFPEGADTRKDKPVKTLDAEVKGNKAEIEFNFKELQGKPVIDEALYRYYKEQGQEIPREEFEFFLDDYKKDIESEIKEKPKYFFTANANCCKIKQSNEIEISKKIRITILDAFGKPVKGVEIQVKESDGKEHKKTTGDEGYIELEDMIPQWNYGRFEIKDNANGR